MTTIHLNESHSSLNDLVKTGDILFFEGEPFLKDPLAKTIEWVTRSKITHVAIAYWIHTELFVIESQYGKNRSLTHIDTFMGRTFHVVKPPYKWKRIEKDVIATISKVPYSIFDLLSVGLMTILYHLHIKISLPDFKGEICSEFVAKLCGISPANISPKQLYDTLI